MKKIKNLILILLTLTMLMTCKEDDNPFLPEAKEYYTLKITVDGEISELYAYIDGGWSDGGDFVEVGSYNNVYEYKIIKDATVVVSVSPINNNYRFMKVVWAGDATPEKENSNSAKVIMDSDKNVLITVSDEKTTLTIERQEESQGKVTVKTNGVDTHYDYEFWKGTEVELTAIPDTSSKCKFDKYIINDKEEVKNTNLTLIMNEDKNVKALFKNTYTLTFNYNKDYLYIACDYKDGTSDIYGEQNPQPNTPYEIPTRASLIRMSISANDYSNYTPDKLTVNGIEYNYGNDYYGYNKGFTINNPNYEDKDITITYRKLKNLNFLIKCHLTDGSYTPPTKNYDFAFINSLNIEGRRKDSTSRSYWDKTNNIMNFHYGFFVENSKINIRLKKEADINVKLLEDKITVIYDRFELENYSINNGSKQIPNFYASESGYQFFNIGSGEKDTPTLYRERKKDITIDLYYKKVK